MNPRSPVLSQKMEPPVNCAELTRDCVYYSPAADLLEDEDNVVILLDMPGASPEDVEVEVDTNILSVTATLEPKAPPGRVLLCEYPSGGYHRSFRLTDYIDQSGIQGSMKDGTLKILLPKFKKHIAKKVSVGS